MCSFSLSRGEGNFDLFKASPEIEEWARAQVEKAPAWSAEKCRRIGALLGLELIPEQPADQDGTDDASQGAA